MSDTDETPGLSLVGEAAGAHQFDSVAGADQG